VCCPRSRHANQYLTKASTEKVLGCFFFLFSFVFYLELLEIHRNESATGIVKRRSTLKGNCLAEIVENSSHRIEEGRGPTFFSLTVQRTWRFLLNFWELVAVRPKILPSAKSRNRGDLSEK